MTVLVGFGPEGRGRSALELGRVLAVSAGLPLVLCCTVLDRWEPIGQGRRVDLDYERQLRALAGHALQEAARSLAGLEVPLVEEVVTARSVPAGLLQAAERHEARLLVAGSSSGGAWGHITLGTVSDRLLHSSPIPVALAPRGVRFDPGCRVHRITVALDGTAASYHVLERAAEVAQQISAQLRVVTFAVRARTMIPPELGLRIEDRVVAEWRTEVEREVAGAIGRLGSAGAAAEARVVEATSWAEALDEPGWEDGELLVVGSSSSQSLWSRVFLGSTAARIVRHSPVPVVVVP